jgi:nitroreductase
MSSERGARPGANETTSTRPDIDGPGVGHDPSVPRDDADARERISLLLRTRQIREFTAEPVSPSLLAAVADAGRWSGSSQNGQPWRFIVIQDEGIIRRIAEAGLPQTRALRTAMAAIAVVLPDVPDRQVSDTYDDGRASERMLVAATMLGLGAGIAWIRRDVRPTVREALGLPDDRIVRTVLAVGHPTEAARQPKAAPGKARLPREQTVFAERWPAGDNAG